MSSREGAGTGVEQAVKDREAFLLKKREQFASYIDEKDISSALVKASSRLYEEAQFPDDPLEFIAKRLCPQVFEEVEALTAKVVELTGELENYKAKCTCMKKSGEKPAEAGGMRSPSTRRTVNFS